MGACAALKYRRRGPVGGDARRMCARWQNGIFCILWTGWIVERTFAWISRNRRLARDFERYAKTVAAFIRLAMIRVMLRRLAANTPHKFKLPRSALNNGTAIAVDTVIPHTFLDYSRCYFLDKRRMRFAGT
jgi:hypothetical protein